jgi:excisionase family DNA binding protein
MKEEVMAPDWKNPMLKVRAPKVVLAPLEPISIQDLQALINTHQRWEFIGERDRAIFLFLLDTGARAREAFNMNIKDIDLNTGALIRYGKGDRTRMVFIGCTTRRAMRAYLRLRHDSSPALFVSKDEQRLTYDGLPLLLERRAKRAKRGELVMMTRKLQTSELHQINLLTIQEVADWAKVRTKTVYRWIADNKIPVVRLGNRTYRIPEKAILDYLRKTGLRYLISSLPSQ